MSSFWIYVCGANNICSRFRSHCFVGHRWSSVWWVCFCHEERNRQQIHFDMLGIHTKRVVHVLGGRSKSLFKISASVFKWMTYSGPCERNENWKEGSLKEETIWKTFDGQGATKPDAEISPVTQKNKSIYISMFALSRRRENQISGRMGKLAWWVEYFDELLRNQNTDKIETLPIKDEGQNLVATLERNGPCS